MPASASLRLLHSRHRRSADAATMTDAAEGRETTDGLPDSPVRV